MFTKQWHSLAQPWLYRARVCVCFIWVNVNLRGPVWAPREAWAGNRYPVPTQGTAGVEGRPCAAPRPGVEVLGEAHPIYLLSNKDKAFMSISRKQRPQRERMNPKSTQSRLVASSAGVGFMLRREQASGWSHPEGLAPWVPPNGQRHQSPLWKATARRSSEQADR